MEPEEDDHEIVGVRQTIHHASFGERLFWIYFCSHRLKFQTLLIPNGMCTSVFVFSHTCNNVGLLNMSVWMLIR